METLVLVVFNINSEGIVLELIPLSDFSISLAVFILDNYCAVGSGGDVATGDVFGFFGVEIDEDGGIAAVFGADAGEDEIAGAEVTGGDGAEIICSGGKGQVIHFRGVAAFESDAVGGVIWNPQ